MKQKVVWIIVRILRCALCILKGENGNKKHPRREEKKTDEKD